MDTKTYLKFRMALTKAAIMIEDSEIDLVNIRGQADLIGLPGFIGELEDMRDWLIILVGAPHSDS